MFGLNFKDEPRAREMDGSVIENDCCSNGGPEFGSL